MYNALTNRSFLDAIRRLNAASAKDVAQFQEVLSEWDILEAVNTAHLVKGRVAIIRKFSQMIEDKVPEKPDMQDYLKQHPWLIDPKWTTLVHEQSLDNLLKKKFGVSQKSKEGSRRLDFFCVGDTYQVAYVVEAKRPGARVGRKEFDQLRDYVLYLRRKLQEEATASPHKRSVVRGLLIADRVHPDDDGHAKTYQDAGTFDIRSWENLLLATETMHKEFLDVVKGRAPADDPRMKELRADDEATSEKKSKPVTATKKKVRQKVRESGKGRAVS